MKKLFVLYDARAKFGDTDDACVYVTASSEKEAREDGKDSSWQDGIWYEYDCDGDTLVNEKMRPDLPPACNKNEGKITCGCPEPYNRNYRCIRYC